MNSKKICRSFLLLLALTCSAWAARTLQDETGRSVTLPDHVNRVICLTPSITDTIYAIGGAPQIIGISEYTQYPPQAAREKTIVGDILNPSLERILSMHPDVVVGMSTLNSPETVKGLERVGIPVFLVKGQGLAGVYSSITNIGRILGRDREATSLVEQLKSREQKVRTQAQTGRHPSVFLVMQLDPCITAGRGAFITELLEAAGARSVTSDLVQDWTRVNLEAIIPRHPEYIVLLKSAPIELKDMQARAAWRALAAVREGRIIRADDRLQSPSPVAFDGLEDLARQIQAAK